VRYRLVALLYLRVPWLAGQRPTRLGDTRMLLQLYRNLDRLCGLVVRVPGYRTEMYYVSCEVLTEFVNVM
jgi:hypothetical protein